MSDTYEKQIADLQTKLEEAQATNEELTQKVVAEKVAEFESAIQSLETSIAEKSETIKSLSETNDSLLSSTKQLEEAAKATDEEIKGMKKREAMMNRKAQLEDLGFDTKEAEATLVQFEDADDATFDKIVAVMATMKNKAGMPPWMKKDKDKEEDKKEEKDAKAEEEIDSAEAGEEALDQVEPVEEAAIAELDEQEDPAESLRSVASEWLGSVLQTLPKQDK